MNKIYFSIVWEDYLSLKKALQPSKNDTILTISSSGDNAFNFLSDKVKKVIAVDFNPAQLCLAKLKLEIMKKYDLDKSVELLEGIGNKKENRKAIQDLIFSDEEFKKYLSHYNFGNGVDNIGELDTKVMPLLRFFMRRHFNPDDFNNSTHKKGTLGIWFTILLSIFSKKSVYKFLMPDLPYDYINIDMRRSLKKSLDNFLRFNDLSKNWYFQKVYYKKYKIFPPFLQSNNFKYIQKNANRIKFIEGDILNYLKRCQNNSVDKMNFSDIFDWCSKEQFSSILRESYRVLSKDGLILYRELFVSRKIPTPLTNKFEILPEKAAKIHRMDNTPFYHRTIILKKK